MFETVMFENVMFATARFETVMCESVMFDSVMFETVRWARVDFFMNTPLEQLGWVATWNLSRHQKAWLGAMAQNLTEESSLRWVR